MREKSLLGQFSLIVATGVVLASTTQAALINLDMQDHNTVANGAVDSAWENSEADGILSLRDINDQWNTFNANSIASLALNDVDGNASGITATLDSFSGSGVWQNSQFANSPVDDVARDYVHSGGVGGIISLTLSGLDATGATTYDIHVISAVLWGGWNNIHVTGNAPLHQVMSDGSYAGGDLVESYRTFSGVTADGSGEINISVLDWETAPGTGVLSGVQIETIPEPATLGLVGMVGAGILFIRRRMMI